MKNYFIIFVFIVVGIFLISKSGTPTQPPPNVGGGEGGGIIHYVKLAGQNIKVDLALTPAAQEQGLSGRTGLAENEGMLFVFPKPGQYLFWMKDMNFPIDMIWINQDGQVIYIKKNATPASYPAAFGPSVEAGAAKYVLEVVSGFADKNNLKVGDTASFTY